MLTPPIIDSVSRRRRRRGRLIQYDTTDTRGVYNPKPWVEEAEMLSIQHRDGFLLSFYIHEKKEF